MIFLGGASEVDASYTLIEIEDKRILVDAGIRQNVKPEERLPDLDRIGSPDAFLLTHAHTDHMKPAAKKCCLNADLKNRRGTSSFSEND